MHLCKWAELPRWSFAKLAAWRFPRPRTFPLRQLFARHSGQKEAENTDNVWEILRASATNTILLPGFDPPPLPSHTSGIRVFKIFVCKIYFAFICLFADSSPEFICLQIVFCILWTAPSARAGCVSRLGWEREIWRTKCSPSLWSLALLWRVDPVKRHVLNVQLCEWQVYDCTCVALLIIIPHDLTD